MKLSKSPGRVNQRRIRALARRNENLQIYQKEIADMEKIPEEKQEVSHMVEMERLFRLSELARNEMVVLKSRITSDDSAESRRNKKYRGA